MRDADFFGAVSAHVLAKDAPASPAFVSADPDRTAAAISIYRNNVRAALSRALKETYPVVEKLVGAEFFKAIAREYFSAGAPNSPMIVEYARNFPTFIDNFPPAATLSYLGDIARLEWAWLEAYRAADTQPLSAEEIAAAGGDDPSALRLQFHPSFQILSSAFPIHAIWRRNRSEGGNSPIDLNEAEDVLVVRPQNTVEVTVLPPGASTALMALHHGASIEDAFQKPTTPDFDPQALFSLVLSAGIVIGATTDHSKAG